MGSAALVCKESTHSPVCPSVSTRNSRRRYRRHCNYQQGGVLVLMRWAKKMHRVE